MPKLFGKDAPSSSDPATQLTEAEQSFSSTDQFVCRKAKIISRRYQKAAAVTCCFLFMNRAVLGCTALRVAASCCVVLLQWEELSHERADFRTTELTTTLPRPWLMWTRASGSSAGPKPHKRSCHLVWSGWIVSSSNRSGLMARLSCMNRCREGGLQGWSDEPGVA